MGNLPLTDKNEEADLDDADFEAEETVDHDWTLKWAGEVWAPFLLCLPAEFLKQFLNQSKIVEAIWW